MGEDVEQLLDVLAGTMHRVGLEQHATFQDEQLLVTGNA
jgi:hypothetical protein